MHKLTIIKENHKDTTERHKARIDSFNFVMWKKKHDPKSIVSISKDFGIILNPNYTYETIISDEDV